MVKNHIKRINAPKKWDILRKETVFISKPNPGRSLEMALSLNTVMKDMLKKSENTKESKYIIKHKGVLVNGIRRYDEKFPVGFLDVVTFLGINESFRLLVDQKNKLFMQKISETESKIKLSKIENKKQIAGGKTQINCTDGRNFLFESKNPFVTESKINDSLVYSIPEQKVTELIKLEKGMIVYLYKGKHIGQIVKINDFKNQEIMFKIGDLSFETKRAYAFAIGKEKPVITVPEFKAQTHKENNEKENAKHATKEKKNSKSNHA